MAQLTYNEAFDPYHTTFRFLRLGLACQFENAVPFDTLRILDYYLLFPFRIQRMSLKSDDIEWRRISRSYSNLEPYGELPDDPLIFSRMEPFQRAAATSLSYSGVLSVENWDRNEIKFLPLNLPKEIEDRCSTLNEAMSDITSILCQMHQRYRLLGRDGLKDRTGLLEHRYDAI